MNKEGERERKIKNYKFKNNRILKIQKTQPDLDQNHR